MSRGADWDSKWRLSIDLCTKCNFIWGREGDRVSDRGRSPPAPSSGYAAVYHRALSVLFWISVFNQTPSHGDLRMKLFQWLLNAIRCFRKYLKCKRDWAWHTSIINLRLRTHLISPFCSYCFSLESYATRPVAMRATHTLANIFFCKMSKTCWYCKEG